MSSGSTPTVRLGEPADLERALKKGTAMGPRVNNEVESLLLTWGPIVMPFGARSKSARHSAPDSGPASAHC